MRLLPSVGSLFDRLCIIAGAFLGSQIPQFMLQYSQRLAGHVAELQKLLNQLRQAASLSHKTLDQYILKFMASTDPDFAHQGQFMQGIVQRWDALNNALVHLNESSVWVRPFAFVKDIQPDIAQSTLASFQPGINFSLEGLCYAGLGLFLGWLFFQLISKSFASIWRFCKKKISSVIPSQNLEVERL
jgi:hypothetical protein